MVEDLLDVVLAEFIVLAGAYSYPGLVEIYYWEVLEGIRQPSYIIGPPSAEAMDMFRLMRDDLQIWVRWLDERWQIVPIEDWKKYLATNPGPMLRWKILYSENK